MDLSMWMQMMKEMESYDRSRKDSFFWYQKVIETNGAAALEE